MTYTVTDKVRQRWHNLRNKPRNQRIIEKYSKGDKTMLEIGEEEGISKARVSAILARHAREV